MLSKSSRAKARKKPVAKKATTKKVVRKLAKKPAGKVKRMAEPELGCGVGVDPFGLDPALRAELKRARRKLEMLAEWESRNEPGWAGEMMDLIERYGAVKASDGAVAACRGDIYARLQGMEQLRDLTRKDLELAKEAHLQTEDELEGVKHDLKARNAYIQGLATSLAVAAANVEAEKVPDGNPKPLEPARPPFSKEFVEGLSRQHGRVVWVTHRTTSNPQGVRQPWAVCREPRGYSTAAIARVGVWLISPGLTRRWFWLNQDGELRSERLYVEEIRSVNDVRGAAEWGSFATPPAEAETRKVWLVQHCGGGIPSDPEAFDTEEEAREIMWTYASDDLKAVYDSQDEKVFSLQDAADERLFYLGDGGRGRDEWRMFEVEV